ncbi:MAG: hypothetical protein IH987_05305 [Planctomycetes bacterium]|nr:hypothetical protein [Planctomycetota bacterium]
MELRSELQFPHLNESKVNRLSELAASIDGARPGEWEDDLAEFNQLAGTSLGFAEFQGIYGGMEHDSWVRNVLCMPLAEKQFDLTNDEMLEIIERLCTAAGEEHEQFFWIKLLETNLDPQISDLIYWPGEYFGDGDNSREMSPQHILETALKSRT